MLRVEAGGQLKALVEETLGIFLMEVEMLLVPIVLSIKGSEGT